VADVVEAELTCFFLKRGNQALVEADGGVAFAAYDVVVMVLRLLRKVKSFSPKRDSLQESGFIQGFEDPIDSGSIAGGGTDLGMNLVWGERSDGFFDEAKDSSTTWGGFQARLAKGIGSFPCRVCVRHRKLRCR
jgi:hypothetical protein